MARGSDLLPVVADGLGLDTGSPRTLWRDRAALEVLRAVQHSFDAAGVTLADHHTEADRFLVHVEKERAAGRSCPAEWSWIVPRVSGALTPVFHRYYDRPSPAPGPRSSPADVRTRGRRPADGIRRPSAVMNGRCGEGERSPRGGGSPDQGS